MKKNYLILFLIFQIYFSNCFSQQVTYSNNASLIATIPFKQFSGGVIVIKAKIKSIPDSLNFILDTGSGGISLDSNTCAAYNITTKSTDTIISGVDGQHKVSFLFDETLLLPNLEIKKLNFHINNYEVLTSVYGSKIDGIIGYSFFNKYIVFINFDSNLIHIYTPGNYKYPNHGILLHPIFTTLPIQWLNIKDNKKIGFNFYFDTGAGLCLLLSEQFAKEHNILLSKRKPVVALVEGMTGKMQMHLTIIKDIKLGPYHFKKVPTYLFKDENNVTAYPFTGGLLGIDLLRRFNLFINYIKREIYISPNSHFYDDFDYAYTGLGIYYFNDKLIIQDIISKSPAEKAGFKIDDEIIGIENNFSKNIIAYKNILQIPNKKIRIIIKRDDKLLSLFIKTQKIK